jgi:hypothetical protein
MPWSDAEILGVVAVHCGRRARLTARADEQLSRAGMAMCVYPAAVGSKSADTKPPGSDRERWRQLLLSYGNFWNTARALGMQH